MAAQSGTTRAGSTCMSVQADKGEPLDPCKIADLPPVLEDDELEDADLEDDEVES